MAKTICVLLGAGFLLVGIVGFLAPNFLGAHLMPIHNVIHIVSGLAALFLGLKGSFEAARKFCITFGAVYGLLGIVGFLAGDGPGRLLTLIPGQLVLGTVDHVIHVILGAAFLLGGITSRVPARV